MVKAGLLFLLFFLESDPTRLSHTLYLPDPGERGQGHSTEVICLGFFFNSGYFILIFFFFWGGEGKRMTRSGFPFPSPLFLAVAVG